MWEIISAPPCKVSRWMMRLYFKILKTLGNSEFIRTGFSGHSISGFTVIESFKNNSIACTQC